MDRFLMDDDEDNESVVSCLSSDSIIVVSENSNNADKVVKYDEFLMDDDDITSDDEASQESGDFSDRKSSNKLDDCSNYTQIIENNNLQPNTTKKKNSSPSFMTKIPTTMLKENLSFAENNNLDVVQVSKDKDDNSMEYDAEDTEKQTGIKSIYLQKCLKCNHEIITCVLKNCPNCRSKMRFKCFVCSTYYCDTKSTIYSHFKGNHLKEFNNYKIQMSINHKEFVASKASNISETSVDQSTVLTSKTTDSTIRTHLDRNCSPDKQLTCFVCDYSSNLTESLQEHLRSVHSITDPESCVTCIKCKKQFSNHICMKKHFKYCEKELYLLCQFCPYKTKYTSNLHIHLKSHVRRINSSQKILQKANNCNHKLTRDVPNSQKQIECMMCTFKSRNSITLKIHMKSAHPTIDTKNYSTCTKCGKTLKNWKILRKHFRFCGKQANIKCKLCPYKTKWLQNLRKHMKCHTKQNLSKIIFEKHQTHGDPVNNYKYILRYCSNCDKTIMNNPFGNYMACGQCNTKVLLKCAMCGKEYEKTENILYHLKHDCSAVQSNFSCLLCNFENSNRSLIQSHMKEKHPNSNNQDCTTCNKCGKEFNSNCNLKKHFKFCGAEKNLKCQFCPFKTKFKVRFNLHLNKHKKHMDFYASSLIKAFCKHCNKSRRVIHSRAKCFKCKKLLTLSCGHCDVECPTLVELRNHVKQHKGSSHKCFRCKKIFSNLENFKAHEKVCKN